MRTHFSKILALLLLIGIAETLSACVVYDGPPRHYYYYDRDHEWHEHDHDGWRR